MRSNRLAPGIGRQIAKSFAAEGCSQIALLDRDDDGLSETARLCKAQSTNVQTFVIPFDVRMESEVEASMDLVVEEWGRIDYAVNCAG
jgi:NAD(P)-dependent dehydrogenase (short-subunit alcohol dehydrogenase family)